MARTKKASPKIHVRIPPEAWERATRSSSGGCLIGDTIMRDHPELTSVSVDMATIRATDRKRGERYIYLTPEPAKMLLLFFDQEFSQPQGSEDFYVQHAVQITRLETSKARTQRRQERRAELEAKEAEGTLTPRENASLIKLRAYPDRPSSSGPATAAREREGNVVVRGGKARNPRSRLQHPNLLAGRDRHYGAKLADPGIAFREAVDLAVEKRLAELQAGAQ